MFEKILQFSKSDIKNSAIFDHSGVTSNDVNFGLFTVTDSSGVIRYRIPTNLEPITGDVFFTFTFSLSTGGPVATHVSIVNETVTDGGLWEIQPEDNAGTFTLSGILKGPVGHVTAYINLSGTGNIRFTIDKLVLAPLQVNRAVKLAFFIDPWSERDDSRWKSDYIWWFGKIDLAVRQRHPSVQSSYVMSSAVATLWETFKPNDEAALFIIDTDRLKAIYPDCRAGIKDQRLRAAQAVDHERYQALADLYRNAFPSTPDIIICLSDMQILKDIFPESLILYRDALYCREPFPDELTSLSFEGLYRNSDISEWALATDTVWDKTGQFLDQFYPKSKSIADLLILNGLELGGFLILPLQDSRHSNFYDECDFITQSALLQYVAQEHGDCQILVTQHPDHKEITDAELLEIQKKHSNIKYIKELEWVKNPTAQILPYCSGIIGVSTGLLTQALFFGIPIHFIGQNRLKDLIEARPTASDKKHLAHQLITNFYASYQYLHNPSWLLARLCALKLVHDRHLGYDCLTIDLPGNIMKSLELHRRNFTQIDDQAKKNALGKIEKIRHVYPPVDIATHSQTPTDPGQVAREVAEYKRRVEITKRLPKGGIGIEIGVAEGVFSQQMLETNVLGHLFSVDMYEGDRGHDVAQYARAIQRLSPHYEHNSLLRMRFEEAINLFDDGFFDLVYIDGYAHTGQENGGTLEDWYSKVKQGGIFAGHDYHDKFPLVVAVVDRFAARQNEKLLFIHDDDEDNWNHGASTWFIVKS